MNTPILLLAAVLLLALARFTLRRATILEHERGLRYSNGRFRQVLEPGAYWHFRHAVTLRKVDIRPSYESISGQELLSADQIGLKVSLVAKFEVADPYLALSRAADFREALHLELQLALREIVSSTPIDDLLANRISIGPQLLERTGEKTLEFGVRLLSVNVKDVMFPGELKKVFAQVVKARKEGQAALERARGETAALRSLANAARMVEDNPALLQLRWLQVLGEGTGNTVVLGAAPDSSPLPVRPPGSGKPPGETQPLPERG